MKFDITKLKGYREDMTADEKLALLDTYEPPAPDLTGYVSKSTFDKTASELAEAKRQLKAKMTEAEQAEAARAEAEQAIRDELETLRRENAITKSRSEFMALGYDDVLASKAAESLAIGDTAAFYAVQKEFIENIKKAERAAAVASDPKPPAGGGGATEITKEQFDAMGYSERLKLYNEQPELFKQFTEVK